MRDRLIELINRGMEKYNKNPPNQFFSDFLADYILEDGWIRPPCKVGGTVWFIRNQKIIETKVDKIVLKYGGLYIKLDCNSMYETSCNSIGKTVFLTREEAARALKGDKDINVLCKTEKGGEGK